MHTLLFILLLFSTTARKVSFARNAHPDMWKLKVGKTEPAIISQKNCSSDQETYTDLRKRILRSLTKELKYFEKDARSVNVDGLYGLRVAQGQFHLIVKDAEEGRTRLAQSELQTFRSLLDQTEHIASLIYAHNKEKDTNYLKRFFPVIDRPYIVTSQLMPLSRKISFPFNATKGETYNEEYGDRCFAELMGTDDDVQKCTISDNCMRYNKKSGTKRYFVTHQLLYFVLAQHVGCIKEMETALQTTTINKVCNTLCNRIFQEVKHEARGNVVPRSQDLFMEQIMLCGALGYTDFAQENWVRQTISWQDSEKGCFSQDFSSYFTGRKLLRETIANDGCLSHKSGLAFGALGFFARYFNRFPGGDASYMK